MLRAALLAALALVTAPAHADEDPPVLGWRIELHACRAKACRVLMLPPDRGGAKYPCVAHASTLQARAAARMAAAPGKGPWTVEAVCLPVRGMAGA